MDSTSNARADNNIVRHEYRILTDAEKDAIKWIKDTGSTLISYIDSLGNSRELSISKTKIEEAVMWAVKHITA